MSRLCFNLIFSLLLLGGGDSAALESIPEKIRLAARRASLDPLLVEAVIKVESNFSVRARSHKGAMGLMQVMPKTAEACGIHDPYHPLDNLMGACACLRQLLNQYRGNLTLALAAYNAGPGNVEKYGGVPPFPETKAYVRKVMKNYERMKRLARATK